VSRKTLTGETRPAVLYRPGEVLSCATYAPAGAQLVFSAGFGDRAPRGGKVTFRVRANGREVYSRALSPHHTHWLTESVPLEVGNVHLEWDAVYDGASGDEDWLCLGSPRIQVPKPAEKRRILVWISQDTLRADHLGAYGYPRSTSPNFDLLAQKSVVFEKAVSTASWTLPSLASQFTSRYPSFHGAVTDETARDPRFATLFEPLSEEGFTVLGVTGNAFVSEDFGLATGFDALWYTHGRAVKVNALVADALSETGPGDLVLFVHYMDPHSPYQPPPPFDTQFGPRKPYAERTPANLPLYESLYDGEIAYADHMIGKVLDALRQRKLLERAVFVYTADHGEEFLDHGGWTHGYTLYEELLHVPFALQAPGLTPARIKAPVSMLDLAPTLLSLLGVAPPQSFQGTSLAPLLAQGERTEPTLFAETERTKDQTHRVMARRGVSKYILSLAKSGGTAREEVFDLEKDPRETRSLIPSSPELRQQVDAYLAQAQAVHGRRAQMSAETREDLRALGYVQ
jgi:arylsulfatase A-like enzyme